MIQRAPSPLQALGVAVVIALILVGLLSLGLFIDAWDPEKPFRDQQTTQLRALDDEIPRSLTFFVSDDAVIITDRDEIREFLVLVLETRHLEYHHSHPVDELPFRFEGVPATYVLARDSQRDGEYWLQLKTEGDLERGFRPTIKLFLSQGLTLWLIRNHVVLGSNVGQQ